MDFYEYPTTRDMVRKSRMRTDETVDEFYKRNFGVALSVLHSKACAIQMINENIWEKNRRPYYNVYPAISPMLLRLNLDVDTSLVLLPMPAFSIRFPKNHSPLRFNWNGEEWQIRSMLVGHTSVQKQGGIFDGFVIWVDTGETDRAPDGSLYPVHTYINLPMQKDMTLEQSLRALPYDLSAFRGMIMPDDIRTACARLVCTICLLGNNPEIIEPDVLTRDRDKYDATKDEKYVNKAKRRGKFGFNVGKSIEVIPHVRRPHPALMHTGHGRTVPRIVLRKGSLIHKDAIVNIPSGFQGLDT